MNVERVLVLIAVLAFIGALYFTGKAFFHAYHVVTNITGKHASLLGPFVLLSPSQFNTKGNQHRVALGPALLGLAACWTALFATGALDAA